MKPIISKRILYFAFFCTALIASCKREKGDTAPLQQLNKAPVARAGPDLLVLLSLCTDTNGVAVLDGRASSDTDSDIISYHWEKIFGPAIAILKNGESAVASVESISAGEYLFGLTVRDKQRSLSRDSVMIRATGPAKEYDFDISLVAPFSFTENYRDYYGRSYDYTEIIGKANFSPFGEFNIGVFEFADTSDFFDDHDTGIQIYAGIGDKQSLYGRCSVNFKKLIRQGGGLISGVLIISSGSVQICDYNVLNNLAGLAVTGNLNMAAGTVDLRIKGKVYF